MNALEEQVREAFDRNVGVPPPRTMPAGTRARVRGRQAGWVAMVCLSVAVVAFAGFQGLSRRPRGRGGSRIDAGLSRTVPTTRSSSFPLVGRSSRSATPRTAMSCPRT